jgi:hypothetical protein
MGRVVQETVSLTGFICMGRVVQETVSLTGAICIGLLGKDTLCVTGAICMAILRGNTTWPRGCGALASDMTSVWQATWRKRELTHMVTCKGTLSKYGNSGFNAILLLCV